MKKLIAILFSTVLFFSTPIMAEIGIGVTANFASIDTDGSETELSGDQETNSTSISEDVLIPEFFVEAVGDNGFTVGVSYVPVRELGAKSRTDTTPTTDDETADAGTYKAEAELDSVIMVYTDIPVGPVYLKLGVQRAGLTTKELLDEGNDYEDADLFGFTVGAGYRGSFGGSMFYKGEVTYTDFDQYSDISASNEHKVKADTEITSLKLSVGAAF